MPRKAAAERRTARQGLSLSRRRKGKAPPRGAAQRDGKARQGHASAKQGRPRNGKAAVCEARAQRRDATHRHSSGVRFVAMALVCADTLGVGNARHSAAMARQSSAWQWRRFERMAATRDASA